MSDTVAFPFFLKCSSLRTWRPLVHTQFIYLCFSSFNRSLSYPLLPSPQNFSHYPRSLNDLISLMASSVFLMQKTSKSLPSFRHISNCFPFPNVYILIYLPTYLSSLICILNSSTPFLWPQTNSSPWHPSFWSLWHAPESSSLSLAKPHRLRNSPYSSLTPLYPWLTSHLQILVKSSHQL